ncbi:bifunctional folylpolyglutamate synthase/dihydrofolate synthase [Candidatus Micrarchaeota archaeon]|nr:bifunctional folylpolyglutamate synthase/dihydrofolate synthase [Candidatus Micrarchaeota archaeon]
MNYTESMKYLNSFGRFGSKFGLERIKELLRLLGNPQDDFKSVHIAGTNGKGSVTEMVSSILQEAGFRTGRYTSPHLDDFRERIEVDRAFIPREALTSLVEKVKPIIPEVERKASHPTFFEVTTAIAFKHFSEKKVDYAVVEVGLGGRLDATNVLAPEMSIITNIGLEHTDILGKTIGAIAHEKGGIIKPGIPVVTAERKREALEVFENICKERGAELILLYKNAVIRKVRCDLTGCAFNLRTKVRNYDKLKVPLLGGHQIENAALSVLAAEQLGIEEKYIRSGLQKAKWPGRLEIMQRKPLLVMDSAHNPPAMRILRNSLKLFKYDKLILVIGVMKDKAIGDILREIAPAADYIIINKPNLERAAQPEVIMNEAKKYGKQVKIVEDVKASVKYAKSLAGKKDMVLVTGSIYMLSEARANRRKERLAQ